jgi:hypothetical protein
MGSYLSLAAEARPATKPPSVTSAAANLFRPYKERTVNLPVWPYGRLRIMIDRRQRFIEVMIEADDAA